MSNASARLDMSSQTGECCQPGVDSAQRVFSQTKPEGVAQRGGGWGDARQLREAEPLVARADVPRPAPEDGARDARRAAQLEREAGAGDRRQPAPDDGVR